MNKEWRRRPGVEGGGAEQQLNQNSHSSSLFTVHMNLLLGDKGDAPNNNEKTGGNLSGR